MVEGPLQRLAVACYRAALHAFPRDFRRRFGADMTDVFADRLRSASQAGRAAGVRVFATAVIGVVRHAAAERDGHSASRHVGGRMAALMDDAVAAVRGLIRRPAFTLAGAVMLGVGLGFNIALFAVVNAVVLRPLPYRDADRVMMLWTGRTSDGTGLPNSYADYTDWKARAKSFSALATYNISIGTLTGAGDPVQLGGATVSPEFFDVLGAHASAGRLLRAGDETVAIDNGRPLVISDRLWRERFGADPSIVGRSVTLSGRARTVIGVMDAAFKEPEPFWDEEAAYWTPLTVDDQMRTNHAYHFLRVIGRLNAGVTQSQAAAEMDGIGRALMAQWPITNKRSVVVASLRDELLGDTRPLLWVFLAAVSLVLLLASGNIVNLLLAHTSGRRREFALRAALGAGRGRMLAQVVIESTALGLCGGVVGVVLAAGGVRLLLAYAPATAPGLEATSIDGIVLVFAFALSALTGALCGLAPAFRTSRTSESGAVAAGARVASGRDAAGRRRWLVGAEVALAMPLLVGAALLTETLVNMQHVDPGFDGRQTLEFQVDLPGVRYDTRERKLAFYTDLVSRLSAIPGATSVGMTSSLPLGGFNNTGGSITYHAHNGELRDIGVGTRVVAGLYFDSLGIPLVKGRVFQDGLDTNVAILNVEAAQQMFGDVNPIGQAVRRGAASDTGDRWLTVVGVVGGVRHERLTAAGDAEMFVPLRDDTWSTMAVTIRTGGDPLSLTPTVRGVIRELDPLLPVVKPTPVSAFVDGQLARPRFGVMCAALFGVLGVALSAFGTFAVLSLLVAQRTREIGIRMALGASRQTVAQLMLRESLVPAAIGAIVGGMGALWATRALTAQLFGVAASDPRAYLGAVGVLTAAACAASWWPTYRATRVDPAIALRAE